MPEPQTPPADDDGRNDNVATTTTTTTTTATPDQTTVVANPSFPELNPRAMVGGGMDRFTTMINDNIIAARYGVFATIALLTAYGISNTPLFFRYRSVAEIPRSLFVGRRRLYCRVIGVHRGGSGIAGAGGGSGGDPIQITVRHLSPIGMLLPTPWFESLMRLNPSNINIHGGRGSRARGGDKASASANASASNASGVLTVRVAGISAPPVWRESHDPEAFLEKLARNRTLVSCQLLGREVVRKPTTLVDETSDEALSSSSSSSSPSDLDLEFSDDAQQQVALCKIRYRPHFFRFFPTDLAEALVKAGSAGVASDLLCHSSGTGTSTSTTSATATASSVQSTEISDASQRIQDLRNDVNYLDNLARSEFEAAQNSAGMWSVPEVRQLRKDTVDEVDFQAKANLFQKIWRRIWGG